MCNVGITTERVLFIENMKKKIISIILTIAILATFFIAGTFLGFEIYRSNYTLEVSNCTVSNSNFTSVIRMVRLADLHNREFGVGNEQLLSLVRQQNPDIICCVGDLVMDDDENTEVAEELIKGLVDIAPVYFSMGNHEVHHQMNFPSDFQAMFETCGANVLEYEFEDIDINGQILRIGGIYGYCIPESDSDNMRYNFKHKDFLKEFMKTDNYTLLLTHLPYTWLELDGLEEWDIDLVYTGHAHGGLIRIPKIGGVHAPLQGLFPGKLEGKYESEDGSRVMILTRGLGTSVFVPRINNVPEVMVVDIKADYLSQSSQND